MNIKEMLVELNFLYPTKRNENDSLKLLEMYKEVLLSEVQKRRQNYDWEKCLKYIQLNRKFATFPSIPEILEALPYCVEHKVPKQDNRELSVVVLTIANENTYLFETSDMGISVSELKEKLNKKGLDYTINFYPAGTVLIGKQIILPEEEK